MGFTQTIAGIPVEFPYKPYDIQIAYMERCIQALDQQKHALLESPTGTGKTLCLLCASLAWLHARGGGNIKTKTEDMLAPKPSGLFGQPVVMNTQRVRIIYAARTHTQLSQVISELKKTKYIARVRILASRQHLCLHPKVRYGNTSYQRRECSRLVSSHSCRFNNNLDGYLATKKVTDPSKPVEVEPPMDIEDLVNEGQEHIICPYYLSRSNLEQADLILVPYNYIIDSRASEIVGLKSLLPNSIVLFDEAHNLEGACMDAASIELTSSSILHAINEIESLLEKLGQNAREEFSADVTKFEFNLLPSLINKVSGAKSGGGGGGVGGPNSRSNDIAGGSGDAKSDNMITVTVKQITRIHSLLDHLYKKAGVHTQGAMSNSNAAFQGSQGSQDYQNGIWLYRELFNFLVEDSQGSSIDQKDPKASKATPSRYPFPIHVPPNYDSEPVFEFRLFRANATRFLLRLEAMGMFLLGGADGQNLDPNVNGGHDDPNSPPPSSTFGQNPSRALGSTNLGPGALNAATRGSNHILTLCETLFALFTKDLTQQYIDDLQYFYRVFIEQEENKAFKINFWCFSAAVTMNTLLRQGVRSIVLTSGTLAPIKSYAAEMGIPFDYQLENRHVIDPAQIFVAIVQRGPNPGVMLDFSYKNRANTQLQSELGKTLVNVSTVVPNGHLVFYASYGALKASQDAWKNGTNSHNHSTRVAASGYQEQSILDRLANRKALYFETTGQPPPKPKPKGEIHGYFHANTPKKAEELSFQEAIEQYKSNALASRKGAIFFGVCRGKASEGIDFSDDAARCVSIVGIPYASTQDPRTIIKRQVLANLVLVHEEYIKEIKNAPYDVVKRLQQIKPIPPTEWYTLGALRAVNQALGRVIRHRYDYGVVLLCDSRFSNPSNRNHLANWIRESIRDYPDFSPLCRDIAAFYRRASEYVTELKKSHGVNSTSSGAPSAPVSTSSSSSSSSSLLSSTTSIAIPSSSSTYSAYKSMTLQSTPRPPAGAIVQSTATTATVTPGTTSPQLQQPKRPRTQVSYAQGIDGDEMVNLYSHAQNHLSHHHLEQVKQHQQHQQQAGKSSDIKQTTSTQNPFARNITSTDQGVVVATSSAVSIDLIKSDLPPQYSPVDGRPEVPRKLYAMLIWSLIKLFLSGDLFDKTVSLSKDLNNPKNQQQYSTYFQTLLDIYHELPDVLTLQANPLTVRECHVFLAYNKHHQCIYPFLTEQRYPVAFNPEVDTVTIPLAWQLPHSTHPGVVASHQLSQPFTRHPNFLPKAMFLTIFKRALPPATRSQLDTFLARSVPHVANLLSTYLTWLDWEVEWADTILMTKLKELYSTKDYTLSTCRLTVQEINYITDQGSDSRVTKP